MARYLLTRSEGTIGELTHLLMAAAVAAVESGEEAITPARSAWPITPAPVSGDASSSGS